MKFFLCASTDVLGRHFSFKKQNMFFFVFRIRFLQHILRPFSLGLKAFALKAHQALQRPIHTTLGTFFFFLPSLTTHACGTPLRPPAFAGVSVVPTTPSKSAGNGKTPESPNPTTNPTSQALPSPRSATAAVLRPPRRALPTPPHPDRAEVSFPGNPQFRITP